MLKKIGCPAAAKSLDGFIKKPAIRRCLVLAAILIFVGVNFSEFYEAKIELAEKERQLANVDEVGACNAKLEWLSQAEGRDAKLDAHKIIRLARITGNPYSVIFEAHGDGLLGLGAKNQDPRRLDIFAGPEQLIPEGIRLTIQEPKGRYDVVIVAEDPDAVVLSHRIKCEPEC